MAELIQPLDNFPGFAVKYDPASNPFFRAIIVENLKKLQSISIGKALLSGISSATPRFRGDFPRNINVICVPTQINFTQSGYKRDVLYGDGGAETITGMTASNSPQHSPENCPFTIAGGSCNEAVDQMSTSNTAGTVCIMRFSNVQIMTRKGEKADPYIVLAHELIHSLHCLQGIKINGPDEELWTTGIGKYTNNPMSENAFRSQFGLPVRNQYF